ncbi:MAG: MraY family glycosyltransferase [Candidatus Omnitrophica bacterium]|nr:MraY family glycosyltransferase [Candidatus Omnitrophota bacterium]
MKSILTFVISFLAAFFSLPLLRALAVRFKIFDFPGERKVHKVATPLMGGAALYIGLIAGLLFNTPNILIFLPVVLGATLIFILGMTNDVVELSARLRFLWQFLIALVVVYMGVHVNFVPKGYWKDILEALITAIWFVGVTNAYNYLDGLDGLAAGSAAINLLCFSVILYMTGQYPLGLMAISLIASSIAFLPYNFQKRKIFLGEAGSTFLGFILAGISLVGNWAGDNAVKLSIPIIVLGVPIFDMIFTTVMRIKEGKVKNIIEWLQYGGKDHFHHYLVDLGLGPVGAVLFIYCVTLALGISAITVSNGIAMEGFLGIAQASIILAIIGILIVVGKRQRVK